MRKIDKHSHSVHFSKIKLIFKIEPAGLGWTELFTDRMVSVALIFYLIISFPKSESPLPDSSLPDWVAHAFSEWMLWFFTVTLSDLWHICDTCVIHSCVTSMSESHVSDTKIIKQSQYSQTWTDHMSAFWSIVNQFELIFFILSWRKWAVLDESDPPGLRNCYLAGFSQATESEGTTNAVESGGSLKWAA